MADAKISALTDGGAAQATDDIPAVRAGNNVRVQVDLPSKANLASPTFTGTPAAPTAEADTNTTQLATTQFVLNQANDTAGTIAMNGAQAAGTSEKYSRADHVHPTDTSRAKYVGTHATAAALETAYPAADNDGASALVGSSAPYTYYISDGSEWYTPTVVEVTPYVNLTATGTAFTGACELAGWDCTAVTSTPTITIYDNTSAAGTVIVPATTLTLGRTEFTWKRYLTTGCHVVLSGTQTVNILVG